MRSEAFRVMQQTRAIDIVTRYDVGRFFCLEPGSPEFDQSRYNVSSTYRKYIEATPLYRNRPWDELPHQGVKRITGHVISQLAINGLADIATAIAHPFSYIYQWDEQTKLLALRQGALGEIKLAKDRLAKHPELTNEAKVHLDLSILCAKHILTMVNVQLKARQTPQEELKAA